MWNLKILGPMGLQGSLLLMGSRSRKHCNKPRPIKQGEFQWRICFRTSIKTLGLNKSRRQSTAGDFQNMLHCSACPHCARRQWSFLISELRTSPGCCGRPHISAGIVLVCFVNSGRYSPRYPEKQSQGSANTVAAPTAWLLHWL